MAQPFKGERVWRGGQGEGELAGLEAERQRGGKLGEGDRNRAGGTAKGEVKRDQAGQRLLGSGRNLGAVLAGDVEGGPINFWDSKMV